MPTHHRFVRATESVVAAYKTITIPARYYYCGHNIIFSIIIIIIMFRRLSQLRRRNIPTLPRATVTRVQAGTPVSGSPVVLVSGPPFTDPFEIKILLAYARA